MTLFELRVPMEDFNRCALTENGLLRVGDAERGVTEEAPETSTSKENDFPDASLRSALFESVAQTEIIPMALAMTPLLLKAFFWVATKT
jgi:hypothetical protein